MGLCRDVPPFNMAWPAGIGKIALPEGRGLEELAMGLLILARVKHVKLASRK